MKWLPLSLLILGHLFTDVAASALPVVMPMLKGAFGLSYFQMGLAATVLYMTSSLIQPLVGLFADRWRGAWLIPAAVLTTSVFMGLTGLVPSYGFLLLVLSLAGVGTAAFHPKGSALAAGVSGTQKGLGMALFVLGGNFGHALGPLVAGFALLAWGLPGTTVLMVLGGLSATLLFRVRGDLVEEPVLGSRSRQGLSRSVLIAVALLCATVSVQSWAYAAIKQFLPLFLQERGWTLGEASWAIFAFLAAGALTGVAGGHLSDVMGRMQVIWGSLLLFPPLMLAYLSAQGGATSLLLLLAAGGVLMAANSVTIVLAQELMPGNAGLAAGLILGLAFGAGGLGVSVTGALADARGLHQALLAMGILPWGALPLAYLLHRRTAVMRRASLPATTEARDRLTPGEGRALP